MSKENTQIDYITWGMVMSLDDNDNWLDEHVKSEIDKINNTITSPIVSQSFEYDCEFGILTTVLGIS